MKAKTILDTIGRTPHVRVNRLFGEDHEVWVKLEMANPGGSIKDRAALAMIEEAEEAGHLKRDSIIFEPTSGNTGISLALAAAVKGYKLVLVIPENMSVERRRLMAAYGALFERTPWDKGMRGAIARTKELEPVSSRVICTERFWKESSKLPKKRPTPLLPGQPGRKVISEEGLFF